MKKLIKNVLIHYPGHGMDRQRVDILIGNGTIERIGTALADAAAVTVAGDLVCFPALVDMQASIGEPGFEYKEDFESAARAAHAGGFSDVVMLPTTHPALDNKGQLQYVTRNARSLPVNIHAYGAISKGVKGQDLSEMYDMHAGGAVAFSDGKHPVSNVNLMKRALEYARNFDGIVCSFPHDDRLTPGGMVHESVHNTTLGLKSTPALAEELMLNRDLYLVEYTGSRLHVSTVSTTGSVRLLKEARSKGLRVTSGVTLANLLYTDLELREFDSVFKTMPPLREENDRQALIAAVREGIIDVVCTDHTPENIENKATEFDHAEYGMTMWETALPLINMHLGSQLGWDTIARAMSLNPRTILGLPAPELREGAPFGFTLFDTQATWVYDKGTCRSKSHNSPVFGQSLRGKVVIV